MDKYDDIINLPHHTSTKRPRMSVIDRAAQFAPFAALTGYDGQVKETERITGNKIELEDDAKFVLNEKLNMLSDFLDEGLLVSIKYFVPDTKKSGGSYITVSGTIKRIDSIERIVVMSDKTIIHIEDILDIESEIFVNIEFI